MKAPKLPKMKLPKVAKRALWAKRVIRKSSKTQTMAIRFGKPVLELTFSTIKTLSTISTILLIILFIFGVKLFISAIEIRNNLGYFINLIAGSDGDILPSIQAVPVFFFLVVNFGNIIVLYRIFDKEKHVKLNLILFVLQIISLILIFIVLILLIYLLSHMYGYHEKLHNGIKDSMYNYSSNSLVKAELDMLQIEFQCCGSKKYDEWYTIKWYDDSLLKKGSSPPTEGNTPFSCCLMSSVYPCIHHNIETTGTVYLYTPEYNLSISTDGCYHKIKERKQSIGWIVLGNLFLFMILQGIIIICLRFIQTAHFEKFRFYGNKRTYTSWLIGCYTGKLEPKENPPPEVPPVPPELRE